MLSAGPVHEAGLDTGIGLGGGRSKVLSRLRRLDVVLAVHPQPLDDLKCVLLMLVYVGIRGFEERG